MGKITEVNPYVYPRIAVINRVTNREVTAYNMEKHIESTTPIFCFTDPVMWYDWINEGRYYEFCSSNFDVPYFYTLH